ncbi:alpha/beta fold hydrolase [Pseudomonas sp. NPDC007930]|uniref:alpha/beta fold hydrolase n=1 Tax=Pseudomonas sp. NPDC007930 TaxID=3364417 RepID=UPI0036E893B8
MPHFDHHGCSLHYTDHGQGTPVLLVHGLGSSLDDWEYQTPALLAEHRVICVDVRGHGRSAKPRERYSVAKFAADTAALLRHLGCGPVHYVGLSMGGMIGFQLAVDHPALLRSLCIVNSGPQLVLRGPGDYWQWFKRWSLLHLVSMRRIGEVLGARMFPLPAQASLRQRVAERWAGNDKRAYVASFNALVGWSIQERIGEIGCPTLIVSGDRDYTPVALKARYTAMMAHARLEVIADSRHATPLDQPERFNHVLLQFIAAVDSTFKDP